MTERDLSAHLRALVEISPMPADAALDDEPERIDHYHQLIKSISRDVGDQIDVAILETLAGSFGLGDGYGIYWGTLHLIERLRCDTTYEVVRRSAMEGAPGVRQWCLMLLGRRRELQDLPIFLARLSDTEALVVVEALRGIRMMAQTHAIPETLPSVMALVESPERDIARGARDVVEEITRTAR